MTTNREYIIVGSQQRLFSGPLRSWRRVWRMHYQTNFYSFYLISYIFAWFRYFEFRFVSSGEPEIVLQNLVCGSIIITALLHGEETLGICCILYFAIFRCNSCNSCNSCDSCICMHRDKRTVRKTKKKQKTCRTVHHANSRIKIFITVHVIYWHVTFVWIVILQSAIFWHQTFLLNRA